MRRKLVAALGIAAMVAVTAGRADAQNKCAGAKLKAAGKKASCLLALESKEASKGDPIDPLKQQKCVDKFNSAWGKAEAKPPCLTTGDQATAEAKIDAFVADVDNELATGTLPNSCQGSKIKAAGKKAKCLLGLESKQASKGGTIDPLKIQKCEDKFSSAFSKAEAKPPCNTTGDVGALEAKVDAFVDDAQDELDPPPVVTTTTTIVTTTTTIVTTTTSTTTTTICNCCTNTKIRFTTQQPSGTQTGSVMSTGSCSEAPGVTPCDSNLDCSGTCTGPPVETLVLTSGGLYFGGNSTAVPLPNQVPDMGESILNVTSCVAPNFSLTGTTTAQVGGLNPHRRCTNGPSVINPEYPGKPGCLFGPPLALPNPGSPATSVCIINRVAANATGTGTCNGSTNNLSLPLLSDLYLTGPTLGVAPCPRCIDGGGSCSAGTDCCESGPNVNQPCTPGSTLSDASNPTSHDCPPPGGIAYLGALPIPFNLSTGNQTKTATDFAVMSQVFCGFCGVSSGSQTHSFRGICVGGAENGKICNGATGPTCPGGISNCVTLAACITGGGACTPTACTADANCSGFTNGCGAAGTTACNRCRQKTTGAFQSGYAQTITENGLSPNACITSGTHNGRLVSVFCIPPSYDTTVDTNGDLPGPGAVSLPGAFTMLP